MTTPNVTTITIANSKYYASFIPAAASSSALIAQVLLTALALGATACQKQPAGCDSARLPEVIVGGQRFGVELALTESQHRRGLSGRIALPADRGCSSSSSAPASGPSI